MTDTQTPINEEILKIMKEMKRENSVLKGIVKNLENEVEKLQWAMRGTVPLVNEAHRAMKQYKWDIKELENDVCRLETCKVENTKLEEKLKIKTVSVYWEDILEKVKVVEEKLDTKVDNAYWEDILGRMKKIEELVDENDYNDRLNCVENRIDDIYAQI